MSLGYFPIYIAAEAPEATGYMPLFVNGETLTTGYFPIIVGPAIVEVQSSFPLFIRGTGVFSPASAYMHFFVEVDDSEVLTTNIPLFVQVDDNIYGSFPIFVQAVEEETGTFPLFITGVGYVPINNGPFDNNGYCPFGSSMDLYIRRLTFSEAFDIFVQCEAQEQEIAATISSVSTVMAVLSVESPTPSGSMSLYIRGKP